jgi:alpha-aminoadipic semialdehyde synthase
LDVFKLLPHEFVEPHELPTLAGRADRFKVYGCIVTAKDMVEPTQPGTKFNKADYYANPQSYRPVFHEKIAPYTSVLVNGMYWDAKYPRLLTLDQAEELETKRPGQFKMVADISCDIKGSVEFLLRSTTLDQPFFVYDPITRKAFDDIDGRGVMMLGVDNLPTSVPREASRHFSEALAPFVPALAEQDPSAPFEQLQAPAPIKNACITSNGVLTPSFRYIAKLRAQKEKLDAVSSAAAATPAAAEGSAVDPATHTVLLIQGHLFDSGFINQALDLLEDRAKDFKIRHWDIGPNQRTKRQTSRFVTSLVLYEVDLLFECNVSECLWCFCAVLSFKCRPNRVSACSPC